MKKSLRQSASVILIALSLSALAKTTLQAAPPLTPMTTESASNKTAALAADASNHFGVGVFQSVVKMHPSGNVFLSPTSLYLALAMTENGAGGSTKTAMDDALSLDLIPKTVGVNAANAAFSQTLAASGDAQVTLSIANALWADSSVRFAPAFLENCRDSYDAQATPLNFADRAASAAAINAWVAGKTQNKISQILAATDLTSRPDIILTNAVYFKGKWTTPFAKSETNEAPFHRSSAEGGDKTVPMMHKLLRTGYLHTDTFDAVRLPYGKGRFAFYGFLPAADSTPDALAASLTASVLTTTLQNLQRGTDEVQVSLPRFKIASDTEMNGPLRQQGMGVAFANAADFKPMLVPGQPAQKIAKVLHKAVLEVDEAGSEAAAATAIIMSRHMSIALPRPHPVIVFDRPFLCALVDDETGAILFVGIIRDPK